MTATRLAIAVVVTNLALAGCGGDGSGTTPTTAPSPAPKAPQERALDHYLCYQIEFDDQTIGLKKPEALELVDQFALADPKVVLEVRAELCNPVVKNGHGSKDGPHLVCYAIRGPEAKKKVRISNQFDPALGQREYSVDVPTRLCLPSGKSKVLGPPSPPAIPTLDHFKCYRLRRKAQANESVRAKLSDQFLPAPQEVKFFDASSLCNPTDKSVDKTPKAKRKRPDDHLVCYPIDAPRFEGREALITNQFEKAKGQVIGLVQPRILCVPSKKTVLP